MPTQDDEKEVAGFARSEDSPEEPAGFARSEVGDDDDGENEEKDPESHQWSWK